MIPASLKEYRFDSVRAQRAISRILEALKGNHLSRDELCKALHKSKTSTAHYLLYLRGNKEAGWPRRIHVADWRPSGGHYVPLYTIGNRPDKPEPTRMTEAERNRRRMEKLRADPVAHDAAKARRRELHNSKRPRDTSLANRILRHLAFNAGQTSREIAQCLDADLRCTVTNLQRLRVASKVKPLPKQGGKRAIYWYLYAPTQLPETSGAIVVKQWNRPRVAQQGWASALGV